MHALDKFKNRPALYKITELHELTHKRILSNWFQTDQTKTTISMNSTVQVGITS